MKTFSLVLLLTALLVVAPLGTAVPESAAATNAYDTQKQVQKQVKVLLLRTLKQKVWRGRYETGRLRMSFPSDFPRTGRAVVRSVLWDEKSRRFSARVVVTPKITLKPFGREDSNKITRAPEREVSLSGEAIPYVRVLAAQNTLLYGTRVTRADLKIVELPHSKKLRSALTRWDQALGKEMRVRRSAGSVLRARDLRPARLVQRRSTVQVIYNEGGVRVVLQALALGNGVHGETVRLRNKFSGREFSAVVDGAGHATVPQENQPLVNASPIAIPDYALDLPEQDGQSLAENPFRAKRQRQYDDLLNQPLQAPLQVRSK